MDYLLEIHITPGVAYGVIDVERLIHNMKLEDNLILKAKGVQAAESMLLARYFMYPSVYQHHTTRIINSMFRRCLNQLFIEGYIKPRKSTSTTILISLAQQEIKRAPYQT